MKNIDILKDLVSTQYNDMRGLVAIDGHMGDELFQLCENNGIDMNMYFLLGFGLSEFTSNGIGQHNEVSCSVLLLEKDKYGYNFDEISRNIGNLDTVDVIKKSFTMEYSDLGNYIKRFDLMTVSDLSGKISKINVIE